MYKQVFYSIAILVGLLLSIQCASTPKTNTPANLNQIVVEGIVVTPTGKSVPGAVVTTLPASEIAITDEQGAFIISRGLKPGKCEFVAETSDGNTR